MAFSSGLMEVSKFFKDRFDLGFDGCAEAVEIVERRPRCPSLGVLVCCHVGGGTRSRLINLGPRDRRPLRSGAWVRNPA